MAMTEKTRERPDLGPALLDRLRKLESAARLALRALTEGMADVPPGTGLPVRRFAGEGEAGSAGGFRRCS